ncbi:MAG TPA: NADH-quinone oxidoreductase subunit C [Acidimicrobiia bacterium]|nr:NADH-quinone oxidoreductase subunit C [Acidimicrobiia bacterium]
MTADAALSHDGLAERFPSAEFGESFGQRTVRVPRDALVEFVTAARDAGFRMFIDLCAVDYLRRDPRFEVVIELLSLEPPSRLRILVGVPGAEPAVPSITGVFAGADFYERETYDLFGIVFEGHPDLTRILLPDDWEGHPLRKDAPVGAVPVQFKGSNQAT